MNAPPLLIGIALVFWGWLTDFLYLGALMAVVVEASRVLKLRWEFSQEDYNQVWNLCSVLFLGSMVYAFTANEGTTAVTDFFRANSFTARSNALNQAARAVYVFVQWLPMMFLPMLLVQAYGTQEKIDFSTFSWFVRRNRAKARRAGAKPLHGGLNVAFPFLVLVLISASAVGQESPRYFWGVCILTSWAIWPFRSRRFHPVLWVSLMLMVFATAFGFQNGVKQIGQWVDQIHMRILAGLTGREFDMRETTTQIGRIGQLKLSDRIVLRIETKDTSLFPLLLRECSYDLFRTHTWSAYRDDLNPVASDTESSWVLSAQTNLPSVVKISEYLSGGNGILALPHGTAQINNLDVTKLETNRLGTVKASGGPGLVAYDAHFDAKRSTELPPTPDDSTNIPPKEATVLSRIVNELKLDSAKPREALKILNRYFEANFSYSTWLKANSSGDTNLTPLGNFLLNTRSGHCEYFATASTLLLRQGGIPARYVTGYSVSEQRGQTYIARERDAHAWCVAWVGGRWVPVDNTPASWLAEERQHRSSWEPVKDFFRDLWYHFSVFRWSKSNYRQYAVWAVVPLLAVITVRLVRQRRKRKNDGLAARGNSRPLVRPGLDSELYEVERQLAALGLGRLTRETVTEWVARIRVDPRVQKEPLERLMPLHYRLRFDPAGLPSEDRLEMRDLSNRCVTETDADKN